MHRKPRAFYSFLISYALILMFPAGIGLIAYHELTRLMESEEGESNLTLLDRAKYTLDGALNEIDRMMVFLGNDAEVRRFALLDEPLDTSAFYRLYLLGNRLSAYNERNRFIHSFYVYFRNTDSVFTREGFFAVADFYEDHFNYGNLSYDEWRSLFLESSHAGDYLPAVRVTMGPVSYTHLRAHET